MPGRSKAPIAGRELEERVVAVAAALGLVTHQQYRVGYRIWGSERKIDVVVGNGRGRYLGIECKYQGTAGTAEEKIQSTIEDIAAWPIKGIVVFDGSGFSPTMRAYLISTGKAMPFESLEPWLRLFFGLSLD